MAPRVLRISLFGALDVRADGAPVHLGLSGATRSLLQYLLCFAGRPLRREALVEIFWPDARPERRRSSLNSAIWRIRKTLAPLGPLAVQASPDCVWLSGADAAEVEIDAARLDAALRETARTLAAGESDPSRAVAALVEALERCEAPPLDGLDDGWASVERERLDGLRMRAMTVAMRALAERRAYDEALEIGRRILQIDPFRECAFQEVMCLHVLNGERAKALQMFEEFRASLDAELGIQPMGETVALREYLASDECRKRGRIDAAALTEHAARPGVGALLCSIEHARLAVHDSLAGVAG